MSRSIGKRFASAALAMAALVAAAVVAGCGDKCEQLCQNVGAQLDDCRFDALTWSDLGARSRADFVNQCQQEWDRERIDLSASDLRLSLEACSQTNTEIDTLDCSYLLALYGQLD